MSAMSEVPDASSLRAKSVMVTGLAACAGRAEGIARIVVRPDQFGKVHKGDILVAATTCPSYNVLLPILGGIVTDRGGLLSHAAIVAREYGLPAVVGSRDATRKIPDGARVRVDGRAGTVELLG
jgi:phosphoenolpyruvate synthase/pyruvate phosphate dikinase